MSLARVWRDLSNRILRNLMHCGFKREVLMGDLFDRYAIFLFEQGRLHEFRELEELRDRPAFEVTRDEIAAVLDQRAERETFGNMIKIYSTMDQAIGLGGTFPDMVLGFPTFTRRYNRETRRSA